MPGGVKDLVAAVLRISLREHHQFSVGRVTTRCAVFLQQITKLRGIQCKSQGLIRVFQCPQSFCSEVNDTNGRRRRRLKEDMSLVHRAQHAFGHSVMHHREDLGPLLGL